MKVTYISDSYSVYTHIRSYKLMLGVFALKLLVSRVKISYIEIILFVIQLINLAQFL